MLFASEWLTTLLWPVEANYPQILQQLLQGSQHNGADSFGPRSVPSPASHSAEPSQSHGSQSLPCKTPMALTNEQLHGLRWVQRQPEILRLAATSNFGQREPVDRSQEKRPVPHTPSLVVLHETVIPLSETIDLFRRHNSEDADQVSYHVLIGLDGRQYRIVPDAYRAYGSGNSLFNGQAVQLNPLLPGSVNNVALHVSLETPPDGNLEVPYHSGYTERQYQALSVVVAHWMRRWRIPSSSLTTHQLIDRDRTKKDPRSFDGQKFFNYLAQLHPISCPQPSSVP